MIILTKINARERCRTCLCKLFKDEDCTNNVGNVTPLPNKFVNVNANKHLQEMLAKYVTMECEIDVSHDKSYPQYLCVECLTHLQTFETFRNKALESAKKLYRIFRNTNSLTQIELDDDGIEYTKNVASEIGESVKEDIFNLFLKDSLMETEAIILDAVEDKDFINKDPDPFQTTEKLNINKKRRTRKTKKSSLSNIKKITRKYKKNSNAKETEAQHRNSILQENENDNDVDWQECAVQDNDNYSFDNEVLINKIQHSEKNFDEKIKKCNENDIKVNTRNAVDENSFTVSTSVDFLEIVKTELNKDVCNDSDGDFSIISKSQPEAKTKEKKRRHCILNSGRKKGLANKYKCDQCQHKFGHKLTLEAHVRKVHEGEKKAFRCQLCDKAYSFIGGLSTHIRDIHERKQDSYNCNVPGCDKKYSNYITLQRHVRLKHLNMETPHQYVCEQCGATFKQSSNLRYHMKSRHPTEEDLKRKELLPKDRLECEECKKSFHSQYTLKYHKLRVHADEKKFECKICGRRVAKQFMLDSHMLVHSDQKLACKFCGREFVRKYQVEAHIRAVHQKLKPFQCPHCSESFASRKTLRHHIYIHTGEKPYVCDICGQAYRQPTCLKNHRKIHSKLNANSTPTIQPKSSFLNNVQNNDDEALINKEKDLVLN